MGTANEIKHAKDRKRRVNIIKGLIMTIVQTIKIYEISIEIVRMLDDGSHHHHKWRWFVIGLNDMF